jgi:hypothetical protein
LQAVSLGRGAPREAYAAQPDYDELVRAVCGSKKCTLHKTCFGCRTKANLIVQIFEDQAAFSRKLLGD